MAGALGLPFSFAHHFAAGNTLHALAAYRAAFRPSGELDRPYAMLGVAVLCAPTDEEAEWLAGPGRLAFLRLRSGRPGLYPTPEEAAAHEYTPFEREMIKSWTASHVVGSPDTVLAGLRGLIARTEADELMVTTMAHGFDDRMRSFELLADVAGLAGGEGSASDEPQRGSADAQRRPCRAISSAQAP